jgi:hypothetical protein
MCNAADHERSLVMEHRVITIGAQGYFQPALTSETRRIFTFRPL